MEKKNDSIDTGEKTEGRKIPASRATIERLRLRGNTQVKGKKDTRTPILPTERKGQTVVSLRGKEEGIRYQKS